MTRFKATHQHLFVDADSDNARLLVLADLIGMLALPRDFNANKPECFLDELADTVDLLMMDVKWLESIDCTGPYICGNYVVIGIWLLEHEPHHLHVVAGVAPVALGIDVSECNL